MDAPLGEPSTNAVHCDCVGSPHLQHHAPFPDEHCVPDCIRLRDPACVRDHDVVQGAVHRRVGISFAFRRFRRLGYKQQVRTLDDRERMLGWDAPCVFGHFLAADGLDELLQRGTNPQVRVVANLHHHKVRDGLAVGVLLQNHPQVRADIFDVRPQVNWSALGENMRREAHGQVQNHDDEQGRLDGLG